MRAKIQLAAVLLLAAVCAAPAWAQTAGPMPEDRSIGVFGQTIHYWDAGSFYVGALNPPNGYAYFYQFGVSSAYPIADVDWHVFMQCPEISLNGSWSCISKAAFISGDHSFWKVIYTFGSDYPGTNFSYLGNYKVEFYYSGKSPSDSTPMW